MKKHLLTSFLSIAFILLFLPSISSQELLIPYRNGDKFGLANEKGQLVVPDRHDEIEYLKPGYFQYLNKTIRKDSSRGYREWEVKTYGLYKSNKLLIADVPFERFFVGKHFIVGSQNPYRPEKCMLYNLAGKPVLSSIAGALYFDDGRDLGELGNLDPNVTLVSIFERHDRSNTVSIAVYDHKKQAIAYWLVKDAQNFKADERMFGATHAGFSYHDEKGYHQKIIRYKNGRFEVLDRNKISAKTMDSLNKARSNRADKWPGDIIGETDFEMPPVVEEGGPGYSNIKTDDNSFYQLYKDSLFFIKTGTRKHIEKPVGSSFVFLTGNATYQQLPIIVKQNGKYGITLSNESLQFPYDSLLYFGMHFIAGKKTTGGYKFGILDRFGKETVPFEYDSIIGDAWELKYAELGRYPDKKPAIVLQQKRSYNESVNKQYYRQQTEKIVVYKNGLCGVINTKNEIMLPVEYEMIAENGFSFHMPKQKTYYILKKGGKYGVAQLNFMTGNRYSFNISMPTTLPYKPLYAFESYGGKKGLTLYALYNGAFRFMGYADNKGKLYFAA